MKKQKITIQEYLSIGYIYLIVLGLVVDIIYYKALGINILNYSTILDVLISPINFLTRNTKTFFFICIFLPIVGFFVFKFIPYSHKKYRNKKWYKKMYNVDKLDVKYAKPTGIEDIIFVMALLIFSMFIGFSMGSGPRMMERLETNDFKLTHVLTFEGNVSKNVKIIGQNSNYVFYVQKGDKEVTISPIFQNIISFKKITENKLDENTE